MVGVSNRENKTMTDLTKMTDADLIALANSRFSNPSLRGDMARMELLKREAAEDERLRPARRAAARKAMAERRARLAREDALRGVFYSQPHRVVDQDAVDFLALLLAD